ncbi:hypothetical protein ACLB2K_032760 [Fragaria x ananassa]
MPSMITKIEGRGNGIKTNVVNMVDITDKLARPPYITKYFGCELVAQSKFDDKNKTCYVNGAHDTAKLAGLLENNIEKYVQCYRCGNPETEIIITTKQTLNLKCAACGHVSDVNMRDKLTNFILKNPPEQKKSVKEKKAAEEEQKKLKKEAAEKKGTSGSKVSSKKKTAGCDEDHSPTWSQGDVIDQAAEEDDDDDVQRQTDTSIEASKKRIEEQLICGVESERCTKGKLYSAIENTFESSIMKSLDKITMSLEGICNLLEKREMRRQYTVWDAIKEIPNLDLVARFKVRELIDTKVKEKVFLQMSLEERIRWISYKMNPENLQGV